LRLRKVSLMVDTVNTVISAKSNAKPRLILTQSRPHIAFGANIKYQDSFSCRGERYGIGIWCLFRGDLVDRRDAPPIARVLP